MKKKIKKPDIEKVDDIPDNRHITGVHFNGKINGRV